MIDQSEVGVVCKQKPLLSKLVMLLLQPNFTVPNHLMHSDAIPRCVDVGQSQLVYAGLNFIG